MRAFVMRCFFISSAICRAITALTAAAVTSSRMPLSSSQLSNVDPMWGFFFLVMMTPQLLARPHNAGNPHHILGRQHALSLFAIERLQFQRLGGLALEFPEHHLAAPGLDDDPIAATERRRRRHDDAGAVPVHRQERIARYLQRIRVGVLDGGERYRVPTFAGGKSVVIETAAGADFGEADERHRLAGRP